MIPTSDQHEHFREQGYIVLKDVLSDELVSSLSELCKLSEEYHEKYSSQSVSYTHLTLPTIYSV